MKQGLQSSGRIARIGINVVAALAIYLIVGSADLFGTDSAAGDGPTKVVSSKHQQRGGMECTGCHKETPPRPLSSKDCLSCHESFEAVAAATAKSKPNPHDSPHYGKELNCELCHHEHSPSESFCAQCHDSSQTVP